MIVCINHTQWASIFVPEFPPLDQTSLGWRFLLHFALTGCFGRTLGTKVGGDVACQPPLWGKSGIAATNHTLQENGQLVGGGTWTWCRSCRCVMSPWRACLRCGSACVSAASSDWWTECCTPCSSSTGTQTPESQRAAAVSIGGAWSTDSTNADI